MQIVIDIPENTYRQIQALVRNSYFDHDICGNSMRRIAKGTPLPKGHGDLVDRDAIWHAYDCSEIEYTMINALDDAPTIIEADKESEE